MARKSSTKSPKLKSRSDDSSPLRDTGDVEMDVPFHALDPAPWNPKAPIHGSYRSGLSNNLDYFGFRDRLKVWQNPRSPGRYFVLDGNQRYSVLHEMLTTRLFNDAVDDAMPPLEEGADPESKEVKAIRKGIAERLVGDEQSEAAIKARVMNMPIPCRVLAELSPDDAKLFTASFDRNKAKYDEAKQTDLHDFLAKSMANMDATLAKMLRPEKAFNIPLPAPVTVNPVTGQPVGSAKPSDGKPPEPEPYTPTEDEPWGKPPDDAADNRHATAQAIMDSMTAPFVPPVAVPTFIPRVFSFTPEGNAQIDDGVLRSKSRLHRQDKIVDALKFIGTDTLEDVDVDDAIVEISLLVYQRRANIARSGANSLRDEHHPGRDDV